MTFTEGLTELLAHLRLAGYSAASRRIYAQQLRSFAKWLRGKRIDDLRGITRTQLVAYQLDVRREPISGQTQALRIRAVKRLYRHLVEQGHLLLDPSEGLQEIRRRKTLPRPVLTLAEMARLLAAPDISTPLGVRDRALLEMLYASGARVGEVEGITLHDLDLTQGLVQLRHTKGGHPRVVPLGHHALHWIRIYLDAVRPHLARHRPFEPALFIVRGSRPLGQHHIREVLQGYCRAAGIHKAVSPHSLRHSCATHLLQSGADLRAIQELLGHRRLSSTVLYTRVAVVEVKAMHDCYHPGNRRAAG